MGTSPQAIARELTLQVLEWGWQPQQLRPGTSGLGELEQSCLEEVIALRESGHPERSLRLIAAAQQLGLSSGWLLDNQARALVELGQRQAALSLWQQLQGHADPGLARTAQEMVALQEQQLLEPLERLCRSAGWGPRHLYQHNDTPLIQRVLEELIASREDGAAELSLQLAQESQRLGWTNPWLRDNEARALVHLGREAEAVAIWQELQGHDDGVLAAAAADMLGLYAAAVELDQQAERLATLRREGRREDAEALLVGLLLQSPHDRGLLLQLGELLEGERSSSTDLLSTELQDDRRLLAALQRLAQAAGAA